MTEGKMVTTVTLDEDAYSALRIHLFATKGGTFSSWVNRKIEEELSAKGYYSAEDKVEEGENE